MLDHMSFSEKVDRLATLVEQSKDIEQEMALLKKALYAEMQGMPEPKVRQGNVSIYIRPQVKWVYSDRVRKLKRQIKAEQQREQREGIAKKVEDLILVAGFYKAKRGNKSAPSAEARGLRASPSGS